MCWFRSSPSLRFFRTPFLVLSLSRCWVLHTQQQQSSIRSTCVGRNLFRCGWQPPWIFGFPASRFLVLLRRRSSSPLISLRFPSLSLSLSRYGFLHSPRFVRRSSPSLVSRLSPSLALFLSRCRTLRAPKSVRRSSPWLESLGSPLFTLSLRRCGCLRSSKFVGVACFPLVRLRCKLCSVQSSWCTSMLVPGFTCFRRGVFGHILDLRSSMPCPSICVYTTWICMC